MKQLERIGKDAVPDIIELMDSYFLTKDDWDAILELGVGPMDMESIKIDSQSKSSFTRLYNQQSHPLPYMKASQVVAPKKKTKDQPDLEEAMEESDSGAESGEDKAQLSDDEPLDLKKDKYVKAPKKKAASGGKGQGAEKGKGKGKGKKTQANDEMDLDDEDEATAKPTKSKGKAGGRTKK